MKRLLALFLALVMLFSTAAVLAGCEDSDTHDSGSSREEHDNDEDDDDDGGQNTPTNGSGKRPAPVEPQLVAGQINTEFTIQAPANAVPELGAWSGGVATLSDVPTQSIKSIQYEVSASVMAEYLQALQSNGFTLVDHYYFSYQQTFESWAFTCNAVPDAQTISMQYETTPCHVSVWMAKDAGKYTITLSPSLQFYDTGLRRDGTVAKRTLSGPSAGSGLMRNSDGSYYTTDGRLSAAVGTAMVIRDGQTYHCDARWEVDKEDERLWVEDYYRNEWMFMEVPKNSLMEGDILLTSDFVRKYYYGDGKEDLTAYIWRTPMFAMAYNDQWGGPQLNGTDYESLTVRLMYYQPGGDAVYYIHAKLRNAVPGEVEALVAVDMGHGSSGSFGNATGMKVGDTLQLTYTGEEFGAHYHVYEWTVTDGADNVSIDGVGKTCQVRALGKGVAVVTVTYRYSVDEPHPLTGNPISTPKSKTQSYQFIIE